MYPAEHDEICSVWLRGPPVQTWQTAFLVQIWRPNRREHRRARADCPVRSPNGHQSDPVRTRVIVAGAGDVAQIDQPPVPSWPATFKHRLRASKGHFDQPATGEDYVTVTRLRATTYAEALRERLALCLPVDVCRDAIRRC